MHVHCVFVICSENINSYYINCPVNFFEKDLLFPYSFSTSVELILQRDCRASVPPCVLTSVNSFSLLHLLRDNWSDFFDTCLGCSPCGLDMHPHSKFSFDPSLNMAAVVHFGFFPVIASSP